VLSPEADVLLVPVLVVVPVELLELALEPLVVVVVPLVDVEPSLEVVLAVVELAVVPVPVSPVLVVVVPDVVPEVAAWWWCARAR
jgi:hypothetical protein